MTSERPPLSVRAFRHLVNNGPASFAHKTADYLSMRLVRRLALSVRDLDRSAVTGMWDTDPEGWVHLDLPQQPQVRQAFAAYPRTFNLGPRFVCELSDCHLVGKNAVAVHGGRNILLETTGNRLKQKWLGGCYHETIEYLLKSAVDRSPPGRDETLFPLICPDQSYYHWMMESLPKLRLLELYQHKTGRRPAILIESNPRSFVEQTLALVGYGPDRWVEWDDDFSHVDQLVVASHRAHEFDYENPARSEYRPSPDDIAWVRGRLRSAIDSGGDNSRRIYVSRQQATRGRKIVNYDEVMIELRKRGFESHALETYPLSEQVRLFTEADVIMGPHGAGLSNIMFADDPHVIELFPKNVIKPHFCFLSSVVGAQYSAVVTSARDNNLVVDMDSFRARLNTLGIDAP